MKEIDSEKPSISQALHDEHGESAHIIRKVVTIGCCVNIVLMVLKLCAGYLGHSEALVADGFHSLNDILADVIMFVFVGISYKAADKKYSYGYGKFGTFASLIMSCLLVLISVFIAIEGIESIIGYSKGEILEQPDIWTFIVILFAMVTKEGLFRFYSHAGRKIDSKALVANAWHHRSDALASIATLIGVTFAHFFGPSFRVLDPVASLVIAVFIFVPAVRMLWPAFSELMDHSLPEEDVRKVSDIVTNVKGVEGLNYLRSHRNGHHLVFDIGIYVSPSITVAEASQISDEIKKEIEKAYCQHVVTSIPLSPSKT